MSNDNYIIEAEGTASKCCDFHTVEAKLFKSKEALRDGIECNMTIQCTQCGLKAADIPQGRVAVFGLPPTWFMRLFTNMSGQLVTLEKDRKEK